MGCGASSSEAAPTSSKPNQQQQQPAPISIPSTGAADVKNKEFADETCNAATASLAHALTERARAIIAETSARTEAMRSDAAEGGVYDQWISAHKGCGHCNPPPLPGPRVVQFVAGDTAKAFFPDGPTKAAKMIKSNGTKKCGIIINNAFKVAAAKGESKGEGEGEQPAEEAAEAQEAAPILLAWISGDGVPQAASEIAAGGKGGMNAACGHFFVLSKKGGEEAETLCIFTVASTDDTPEEVVEVQVGADGTVSSAKSTKGELLEYECVAMEAGTFGGGRIVDGKPVKCHEHAVCPNPKCPKQGAEMQLAATGAAWRCKVCSADEHAATDGTLFACQGCQAIVCAGTCVGPPLPQCPTHGVVVRAATWAGDASRGDPTCDSCQNKITSGSHLRFCHQCNAGNGLQTNLHQAPCTVKAGNVAPPSPRQCYKCNGDTVKVSLDVGRWLCPNTACSQLWAAKADCAVCVACDTFMCCTDKCTGPGRSRYCEANDGSCKQYLQISTAAADGWRCMSCDKTGRKGDEVLYCSVHNFVRCMHGCDGVQPTLCPQDAKHGPMTRFGTISAKRSCSNCSEMLEPGPVRCCGVCLAIAHDKPCVHKRKLPPAQQAAAAAAAERDYSSDDDDFQIKPECQVKLPGAAAAEEVDAANVAPKKENAPDKWCKQCEGNGQRVCPVCEGDGKSRKKPIDRKGNEKKNKQSKCGGCGGSTKVLCCTCGGTGKRW